LQKNPLWELTALSKTHSWIKRGGRGGEGEKRKREIKEGKGRRREGQELIRR